MKDRVVQYPNRFKLVPVHGTTDIVDLVPVPGTITDEGTPLSKGTLLSDPVGLKYGLDSAGTVSQALEKNVQDIEISISTNWVTETNGFSQQITVAGITNFMKPTLVLKPPIATVDEVETAQGEFSKIYRFETLNGAVKLYALEKTESVINCRLVGV